MKKIHLVPLLNGKKNKGAEKSNSGKEINILQMEEVRAVLGYIRTRQKLKWASKRKSHALWITLALFSGLREGEIAKLKWKDVLQGHRVKRWFSPWNAKKGSRMKALMNTYSEEIILSMKGNKSMFIFPGPKGKGVRNETVYTAWQRIQLELWGCRIYTFHDLRHTAITNFYKVCRDIELTRQFARHKSYLTTQRYVHIVEREKCVDVLDEVIREVGRVAGFIGKAL